MNGPSIIGRVQQRVEEVLSTSDLAFELAAAGCPEGTIVVAEHQTAGRGRQGRRWFSVKGGSLTFSVVLRPTRDRRSWPELPLVCAGAVAEVIRSQGVVEVILKAPNDVLAGGGGKIAGVLLENRVPGKSPVVVAGIGVNVNIGQGEFPRDLRDAAVSLEGILGEKKDAEEVLGGICRSLDELYRTWQRGGIMPVRARLAETGIAFRGFEEDRMRR